MSVIGDRGRLLCVGLGGSEIELKGPRLRGRGGCDSGEIGDVNREAFGLRNELAMLPTKADIGLLFETAEEGERLVVDGSLGSSPKEKPTVLTGLTVPDRCDKESETDRWLCWLGVEASADL